MCSQPIVAVESERDVEKNEVDHPSFDVVTLSLILFVCRPSPVRNLPRHVSTNVTLESRTHSRSLASVYERIVAVQE